MKRSAEQHQVDQLLKRLVRLGYPQPTSQDGSGERPDFVLTISGEQIGLETTTAVYQELTYSLALERDGELGDPFAANHWLVLTNLKGGKTVRKKTELKSVLLDRASEWKTSEAIMREWRDKISSSLNDKRAKLNKNGFRRFLENWLLIADFPSLANDVVTFDLANEQMLSMFRERHKFSKDFSTVFVLSGHYLFRWANRQLSLHHDQCKA